MLGDDHSYGLLKKLSLLAVGNEQRSPAVKVHCWVDASIHPSSSECGKSVHRFTI